MKRHDAQETIWTINPRIQRAVKELDKKGASEDAAPAQSVWIAGVAPGWPATKNTEER